MSSCSGSDCRPPPLMPGGSPLRLDKERVKRGLPFREMTLVAHSAVMAPARPQVWTRDLWHLTPRAASARCQSIRETGPLTGHSSPGPDGMRSPRGSLCGHGVSFRLTSLVFRAFSPLRASAAVNLTHRHRAAEDGCWEPFSRVVMRGLSRRLRRGQTDASAAIPPR